MSFDSLLKGIELFDVVEDGVEVHVDEGGSRSSESNFRTLTPCNCFTVRMWTVLEC